MVMYFVDKDGNLYQGEKRVGDREATQEEVVAKKTPRPPSPRCPMGNPSTAVAADAGVPGILINMADWHPPEIAPIYTATRDRIAISGASRYVSPVKSATAIVAVRPGNIPTTSPKNTDTAITNRLIG